MTRTVFMGTPDFAATSLQALIDGRYEIVGVVTQPDRAQGRGRKLCAPPVKQLAEAHGLPVLQPKRIRGKAMARWLDACDPELIIVAAYGRILPPSILERPRYGCVNVHGSLLPKYRGAAPIQWSLINGDNETGVTIMLMDEGMDTGPMLAARAIPIARDETAGSLHDRLAVLGATLLVETLPRWIAGEITPQTQDDSQATVAPMLCKGDGCIDWSLPAAEICCRIRGVTPWPGAFTLFDGTVIKVFCAAPLDGPPGDEPPGTVIASGDKLWIRCGNGILALEEVQRQGKRRMSVSEMLKGLAIAPGMRLGRDGEAD